MGGAWIGFAGVGVAALALAFAALSDVQSRTIPDAAPIALAAGFACAALAGSAPWQIGGHALTALAVLALGFALFAAGWLGGGDGKLAAAVALWLGPWATLDFIALTAILGGALALAILAFRAAPLPAGLRGARWARLLHAPRAGIPYGVAIAAAGIATLPQSPLLAPLLAPLPSGG